MKRPIMFVALGILLAACTGQGEVAETSTEASSTMATSTTTATTASTTTTTVDVTTPPPDGGATMALKNFAISPGNLTIEAGETVRWVVESGSHTSTSTDGLWESGALSVGEDFSFTFDEPGTYRVFCSFHPDSMTATITVEG